MSKRNEEQLEGLVGDCLRIMASAAPKGAHPLIILKFGDDVKIGAGNDLRLDGVKALLREVLTELESGENTDIVEGLK